MSQGQLPKATMVNFIKDRIKDKRKVSAEFISVMLDVSKQFIQKVSAEANNVCQNQGKKTINNQHLYKALDKLKMGNLVEQLQKIDQSLKLKQQKKQEVKQQVQENIQRINSQQQVQEEDANFQRKIQDQMPIIIGVNKPKKQIVVIQEDEQQDFACMLDSQQQQPIQKVDNA